MDRTGLASEIAEGAEVHGSDGGKVGSVVEVRPGFLVVEKGFFFPTDYYVPVSAVAGVEGGHVTLNVTKDAALNQGWDAVPADDEDGGGAETTVLGDASGGLVGGVGGVGVAVGDAPVAPAAASGPGEATTRTVGAGETVTVPVREEELTATKTAAERGSVRIEKAVVAEERTLSVPVTEERVRVERHAVDRPVEAGDAVFRDEVIEVPVYGEDVRLQTSVRVSEEVEVAKEAVERIERVTGTVRHEEVRVTDDVEGGVDGVVGEGAAVIDPSPDPAARDRGIAG